MGLSPKAVRGFAAFSTAALVTVALLPATSTFVRAQFWLPYYAGAMNQFSPSAGRPPAEQRLLARNPRNVRLRLAVAHTPEELRQLVREFPHTPAVYAAYLSAFISDSSYVRMDRPDEMAFENERSQAENFHRQSRKAASTYPGSNTAGGYPGPGDAPPELRALLKSNEPKPKSAAEIADMERVAVTAERLDPSNAFFPAVRAYILFAHRQDAAALAEVQQASRASRWETYSTEPQWGRLQLLDQEFHNSSGLGQTTIVDSGPLGPSAAFREVARLVNYKATMAARGGHAEEDIALRHAVLRWGVLMSVSHITLQSLVGIAIASIGAQPSDAWRQPGYTPALRRQPGVLYEKYLRRTGHPQEAAWVKSQCDILKRCRAILTRDMALPGGNLDLRPMYYYLVMWYAGLLLLISAVGMLLVGGLAAVVLKRGERVRLRWFWLIPLGALPPVALASWAIGQLGGVDDVTGSGMLMGGLALALPALAGVGSGVYSLRHRIPLLTGVARGTAAAAVPAASLAVLLYALLAPFAASADREISARALQQLRNETGAAAAHVHLAWPAQVPE